MKKVFKAKITYRVEQGHPDIECLENVNEVLEFEDTYTMDTDNFWSVDHMIDHIKYDLALVAGGGYSTEHIGNVKFDIKRIA